MTPVAGVDTGKLRALLDERVDGEVRFDPGTLGAYAQDASNYRQVPIGVVVPRTVDAAVAALAACREAGAPVLSRGGGTSLAGQCVNAAVVIDWTKYCHRVVSFDKQAKTAIVEPGAALDKVNDELAPHGLMVGPKPSTHVSCTIGGMIGNNSCGSTAQAYGKMADSVRRLEVLTYGGLRTWTGETSDEEFAAILCGRRRAGPNCTGGCARSATPTWARSAPGTRRSRAGCPGTTWTSCCRRTGSTWPGPWSAARAPWSPCCTRRSNCSKCPGYRSLVVLGYPDIAEAADVVPQVVRTSRCRRGLDDTLISLEREEHLAGDALDKLPEGSGWLMIQFGGDTKDEADAKAHALIEDVQSDGDHAETARRLYRTTRRSRTSSRTCARRAWARPPTRRASTRRTRAGRTPRSRRTGSATTCATSASCWSATTTGAPPCTGTSARAACTPVSRSSCAPARASRSYRSFVENAADLVVSYGGSLSGEHGDGQSRGELLLKMFGPDLIRAFGELKAAFDPGNRMNPGKIVEPLPAGLESHPAWLVPEGAGDGFPLRPATGEGSPTRRRGASGWASAAATRAGSCARATGPPARRSIPPGAGPGC